MLCKKHLEARLIGKGGEAHCWVDMNHGQHWTTWQIDNWHGTCILRAGLLSANGIIQRSFFQRILAKWRWSCPCAARLELTSRWEFSIVFDFIISVFFSTAASCFLWSTHVRPYCTNWYKLLDEYPVGPTGDKAPGIQRTKTNFFKFDFWRFLATVLICAWQKQSG